MRTSGRAIMQGSRPRGCCLSAAARKWPLSRAAGSRGGRHGHVPRVCMLLSGLSRCLSRRSQLAGAERQLELAIRSRLQADFHLILSCCLWLLRRAGRLRSGGR